MKKFDLKELLLKLPGKKKPEPVNTALMRERMQHNTIEKLETVGRELKERRPRFLGSGHITILGPVACFYSIKSVKCHNQLNKFSLTIVLNLLLMNVYLT